MKRFLLGFISIISSTLAFAQPYGNEWIDYDQRYLRMYIANEGIYRIDQSTLSDALADLGVPLASVDPRNFQIFNNGEEQYIFIAGEADGSFDAGDFIEFYGNKNSGALDSLLFDDDSLQLHQYESIINDTAAYFLTWNTSFLNRRMTPAINDLAGAPPAVPYFINHALIVYGSGYGSANFNPGPSYLEVHSSKYGDGEGYTTPKYNLSTFNVTVNTPNYYFGSPITPTLKTVAIGANASDHHVVINFNGSLLVDSSFTGYKVLRITKPLPDLGASNTVSFVSGPLSTDYQRYSFVDVTYPKQFDFDNASRFKLIMDDVLGPTTMLALQDVDEKATSPLLYDFTNHRRMVAIVDADVSKFHMPFNASDHRLYVTSQDATDIKMVLDLKPVDFVDYTDPVHQGDYLIISHKQLFDDGFGVNYVQQYADYRASAAGGGHTVQVVDIDDLYDEFFYGIKKHPLAIRNFILYAKDNFDIAPENVFLIGKSFSYDVTRANGTPEYGLDLVPTFGHPGADNVLAARRGDILHVVPLGRLVAQSPEDVRIYLDKVQEYEAQQADPVQTVANKLWMKNVLHFAGGLNTYEQSLFNNFLFQYATTIEDTLFGAKVQQFNKLTTDPIFFSESEYIDSVINNGVTLITFFGHSSTGSFDYNIGDPEDFTNEGKYFTIFGNGCNTAAIHGEAYTLGERYIFADHKGAVAFIAASNFSLASSLNNYANMFYKEYGNYHYNESIGQVIRATSDTLWPSINIYEQLTIEYTTLQGDPALRLNTHPQPDYDIEAPLVSFLPDIITPGIDTFYMQLIVSNLGMAIDTSYYIEVKRTLPDGSESTYFERHPATYYQDTVLIPIATGGPDAVGINEFTVHVDKENEIDEIDELNNILGASVTVISDDALPIYPVEFSIMNHVPEYFAASTSYVFADEKLYLIEADTTMQFNSPLRRATTVLESGGVVYWKEPPMTWINNTVYYWRITPDTSDGSEAKWRSSSFLYLPGDNTGWSQSHYFQFQEDELENIQLEDTRRFEFLPDVITYEVATGIYPTTNWTEVTSYVDGELLGVGSCASAGFVVIVADAHSGLPWTTSEVGTSNLGPYGDIYCSADPYERIIQFNTNTPERREALYQFMMSTVPDSSYFICYSNNYAEFNTWLDDTLIYGHSLFDAFTAYGADAILGLSVFDFDRSYIFHAKKGDPSTAFELIGDEEGNKIESTIEVQGNWNIGFIETPWIGPAFSWDNATWDLFAWDDVSTDISSLSVFGLDTNGVMTEITNGLISGDTTLAFVDAQVYPFLKLRLNTQDDSLRTPSQIGQWKVLYAPVPEAALNPNMGFVYTGDTVDQGASVSLQIAITNVSDYDLDSLLITFDARDANNILHPIPFARQDSLLTDSTRLAILQFNTASIPAGQNTLIIEVNPDGDQPEQYHVNNVGYLPFYNAEDVRDPLLDVTFDGMHILDGDLVSARPDIVIALKDENQYLAMNDTALLQVSVEFPDGTTQLYPYDNIITRFIPADTTNLAENNTARVEMSPVFDQDGLYTLKLRGQDKSGNRAGDLDYRLTFEVINQSMISNVLTYPNPFSTQTRFVFTLTGSEVPDYFKIQIITVSGKVVREILSSELGPIHIGNNITEFAWDGTDQYGDKLANGLYLYRVVTRLQGSTPEHYDTGTDQYFTSGYGKIYIAR